MKLKLGTLVNAQPALDDLGKKEPIAAKAWRIKGVLKAVEEPLARFQNMRNDLIKKYGEVEGDIITVKPGTVGAKGFNEEINQWLNEDVELSIGKLPADTIDGLRISAGNLFALDWLIDEPPHPDPAPA